VVTKNDANKEERLDELVAEVERILESNAVTGYNLVHIIQEDRAGSDHASGIYLSSLTVEAVNYLASGATTPGSITVSDWTVDTLTVNTSIAGSPACTLGATTHDGDVSFAAGGTPMMIHRASVGPGATNVIDFADNDVYIGHNSAATQYIRFLNDGAGTTVLQVEGLTDSVITTNITEIADLLMLGSANAAWVPCVYEAVTIAGQIYVESTRTALTMGAVDVNLRYLLPLPTTKGTLKLYVSDIKLILSDADANDYVTAIATFGVTDAATTLIYMDTTDRTAAGTYTSATGDTDVSSYSQVIVRVNCECTTGTDLDIGGVLVACYYA
jgi:hypothetical protein